MGWGNGVKQKKAGYLLVGYRERRPIRLFCYPWAIVGLAKGRQAALEDFYEETAGMRFSCEASSGAIRLFLHVDTILWIEGLLSCGGANLQALFDSYSTPAGLLNSSPHHVRYSNIESRTPSFPCSMQLYLM